MQTWKKIKEERVYDGYRKVSIWTFELPDGKSADFDIMLEGRVVCIVALTPDQKVIMAKQFRPGPQEVLLELPGGGVDKNETPEEAAARELLEETGYAGDLALAGTYYNSAYSDMVRHSFVALNLQKVSEVNNPEAHEITEPVLLSLAEFREHLRTGKLTNIGGGYQALDYLGLL